MPPLEYSWEVRERAKESYVVDGCTFEEVAAVLAREFPAPTPSVTQLKRWSAEEKGWAENEGREGKSWNDQRKDFVLALSSIRRDSVLLRAKLIGNALGEPEFKKVLSAAMWEKTQNQGPGVRGQGPVGVGQASRLPVAEDAQEGMPAPLTPSPPIRTPQEAVAGLEEALAGHLQAMLAGRKSIDLKALKDFRDCLALVEELKTKYKPDEKTGQAPGLSDELAEQIRQKILGTA